MDNQMQDDQTEAQWPRGLNEILREGELAEFLGVKKSTLMDLRLNHKLPFIKVNDRNRLYYVPDIVKWLAERRRVLNKDIDPSDS